MNKDNARTSIILGALTLILFATKMQILDLIEPSKSIGQRIGESAKDVMDIFDGKSITKNTKTSREMWSNIITICSFLFFTATVYSSLGCLQMKSKRIYGIGGIILATIGLGIFLTHLAIGLVGFIIIAVLGVILVFAAA
ncbi:MAG: hypothetical protein ACPGTP_08265 [Bacteroidia bacterium]